MKRTNCEISAISMMVIMVPTSVHLGSKLSRVEVVTEPILAPGN